MKDENLKRVIRKGYAKVAKNESSCCGPQATCGSTDLPKIIGKKIGYSDEELGAVPEGANLGLGCGNPVALASLKEGDVVLDLGSGAGFDCFIAARKVGEKGRVIGVDMTPEMIDKARGNAGKGNYANVEFRLGEIENLPVADNSVDVVISNCVINLSPEKKRVFQEAFRVLRAGGRLVVSDIVLLKELPDLIRESIEAYVGCISSAMIRDEYLETIKGAGFEELEIIDETAFPVESMVNDPTAHAIIESLGVTETEMGELVSPIVSIKVYATKPNET